MIGNIPEFYKNHPVPEGYFDAPNPYVEMDKGIDLRGILEYSEKTGVEISKLTYEEMMRFYN